MKISQKAEQEAQERVGEMIRQYRGLIASTPYAADIDIQVYATNYAVRIVQKPGSELSPEQFADLLDQLNLLEPDVE